MRKMRGSKEGDTEESGGKRDEIQEQGYVDVDGNG